MDNTTAWLDAAGSVRLLTKEEAIQYARQIQAWQEGTLDAEIGQAALNKMITHNLRLVVKIWRSQFAFIPAHDPRVVDLLQEGAMGLRTAALKFEPKKGYTFATYSVAWVRKYMGSYLRDRDRTIRLSADCYATANSVNRISNQYLAKYGKQPTLEQLSQELGKSPESIKSFMRAYDTCNTRQSLDERVYGTDRSKKTHADSLPSRESYDYEADKRTEKYSKILEIIFEAAGFDDNERTIVRERCLFSSEPRSFKLIAQDLGMKPNAVRPHFGRLIKRLEKAAQASGMSMAGILSKS
jgi:RNA polymerase sigma factor (sigma-70 family)